MSAAPGPVSIRRAVAADWDQIWPIWHAVVAAGDTSTYEPSTSSAAARDSWLVAGCADETRPHDEAWVAVGGEKVLGVIPRGFRHPLQGLIGLHVMYRGL